eukprot:TRINITY_DN24105_c0_g1_i1.p1 TRINITY_DN24105_c0_g1~~TRINITY_DN24105_c0_g1_i1.p1  ORF type:complete len:1488 (+),score=476.99 TRINITY_DN24105_c0_g1_i1:44-4507(+)
MADEDKDRCKDCGDVMRGGYCAKSGRRHKSRSPSPIEERREWIHPPGRSSPPRNRSRSSDTSVVWQDSVLVTPMSKSDRPPRSPASRAKHELAKATQAARAEQLFAESEAESCRQSTAISEAHTALATTEALQTITRAQSETLSHAETLLSNSPEELLTLANQQHHLTEHAREEADMERAKADQARADAIQADLVKQEVEREILKAEVAKRKAEAAEEAVAAVAKELEEIKAEKAHLEASIAAERAAHQNAQAHQTAQAHDVAVSQLPASPLMEKQQLAAAQPVPVSSAPTAAPLTSGHFEAQLQANAQALAAIQEKEQLQAQAQAAMVQSQPQSLTALPASPTRQYTSPSPVRSPPIAPPQVPQSMDSLPYTPHATIGMSPAPRQSLGRPFTQSQSLSPVASSPYRSRVLESTKERLTSTLQSATDLNSELMASRTLALQALKEKEQEKEMRLAAERQVKHAASTLDTLRLANEELQKALHDTKQQLQSSTSEQQDEEVQCLRRSLLAVSTERDAARASTSNVLGEITSYMRETEGEKDALRNVVNTLKELSKEKKTEPDAMLIQSIVRQELSVLQPTDTEESLRQALVEERHARAAIEDQLQRQATPYTEEALRHALAEEKRSSEAFCEALNKERDLRLKLEEERSQLTEAAVKDSVTSGTLKGTLEKELERRMEAESVLQQVLAQERQAKQAAEESMRTLKAENAEAAETLNVLREQISVLENSQSRQADPEKQEEALASTLASVTQASVTPDVPDTRVEELQEALASEQEARNALNKELQLLRADRTPEALEELKAILVEDREQTQAAAKVQSELLEKERMIQEQQSKLAETQSEHKQVEEELRKVKEEMQTVILAERQLRLSAQDDLIKLKDASVPEALPAPIPAPIPSPVHIPVPVSVTVPVNVPIPVPSPAPALASDNQQLKERLDMICKNEDTMKQALAAERQLRENVEHELERVREMQDPTGAVRALSAAHEELVAQKEAVIGIQRALQDEQQARHQAEEVMNSKTYLEEGLRRALSDEQRRRAAAEDELHQHRSFALLSHNEEILQNKLKEAQEARSVVEDQSSQLQLQLEESKQFNDKVNSLIEAEKSATEERINTMTATLKKREEELNKKDNDRRLLAQREMGLLREEHLRLKALVESKDTDVTVEKNKIRTLQERLKECRLQNKRGAEERKRLEQEFRGMEDELVAAKVDLRKAKDTSQRVGEQKQRNLERVKVVETQEERILELQRELRSVRKQLRSAREEADMAMRERNAAFEETGVVEEAWGQAQATMHAGSARVQELQNNLRETEGAKEQADQDVMLLKRALVEANEAVNQSHAHLEMAKREMSLQPEVRDRSLRERSQSRSQSMPYMESPSLSPSRGQRGSVEVGFEDAVTGEYHVFNISEWLPGAIQYTTGGEARPPTRRIAFDPVKGKLRLVDTGRHVDVPMKGRGEVVAALRQLADQAGIPHNISQAHRNTSVSPAPPPTHPARPK